MHTEELGIDSLVAVDLRSWFIKEMSVEMPVLKILGGGTVAELIIDAVEKLPTSLIPNIGKEVDPSSKIQVKSKPSESDPATERNPIVMNDERSYDESEEEEEAMVQLDSPTFDQVQKTSTSSVSQSQDLVYAKVSQNLLTSTRPKSVSFDGRSTPSLEVESDVDSAGSSYDGNTGSKSYLPPRSIISNATSVSISSEGGYLSKFDDEILERAVPMSFGQSRFWFLKFYLDDPTTFNITTSIRLKGCEIRRTAPRSSSYIILYRQERSAYAGCAEEIHFDVGAQTHQR
jgi:hybrid polyketide synthase/nonribosomal peptide synthetase ACE1